MPIRACHTTAVTLVIVLLVSACAGLTGCAEAASAVTAVETAKTAVDVAQTTVETVPAVIGAMADAFANGVTGGRSWGRPSHIIVSRDYYVFLYPTPQSELRQGHVRQFVIERTTRIERLQRLERGEL